MTSPPPAITPARTALLVMHYQTDIMDLFRRSPPRCWPTRGNCAIPRAAPV